MFGQPFTAAINGITNQVLTNTLNSLNETGPQEHFLTIGISTLTLLSNNVLTLKINEGGDGGDGWAVDFLTIGVTTQAVPEPKSIVTMSLGMISLLGCLIWQRQVASVNAAYRVGR